MEVWNWLVEHVGGGDPLRLWLILLLGTGLIAGIASGFFKARKIQPNGFKWKTFRNEAIIAVIGTIITAFLLGGLNAGLRNWGLIGFNHEQASWWVVALEYTAYFVLFDTWFYWLHRAMHVEPFYKLIHKLHHWSTSPNLLTTLSVSPIESLVNGGFVPLFLAAMATIALPVHDQTMALIGPTNIIMGLYVHAGYEFFPRWWNRSWLTKWFITTTFHDQHHKHFTINFGGYTTIWDRLCGTMRPKYEAEFVKIKDRVRTPQTAAAPVAAMVVEQG